MAPQMSCPDTARLKALLDGTLPEDEQAALSEHLDSCARCQQTLEGLAAGRDSWSGAARHLGQRPAGEAALEQAVAELEAEAGQPTTFTGPFAHEELRLDFLGPSDKPGHLGRLGHYEVLEVIGRGGMGVVLKAFDTVVHRTVAIKVMAPQLATSGTARKRFLREARAAGAVSHDHVVTIHAVEEQGGLPYLVMQYVAGLSLQQRLDRSGPLELKEILRIGMQTAAGLAAAHAQGLIHRDIKPGNILLENGVERVRITDFGLARAADDASISQSGLIAGTPQYMAPEQARGEAVDHRADLFSLGSVLYAMGTGRPPFRASSALAVLKRVCEDAPRPIREINSDIPEWLCDIVARLHAKEAKDRFPSAQEVADLLGRHLAHLQQPSQVPLPPPVERPADTQAVSAAPKGVAVGDRVLAPWERAWLYPATVGEVQGESLYVYFDDGCRSWVKAADVRPLDVQEGSRVQCRWQGGSTYYSGTVTTRSGDQIYVEYDDGDEEWSTVGMIRVSSGRPAAVRDWLPGWLISAAVLLVVLLWVLVNWLGPKVLSWVSSTGKVIVETEATDVQVIFKQDGKPVLTIDPKVNAEHRLEAGTYEVEVVSGPPQGAVRLTLERYYNLLLFTSGRATMEYRDRCLVQLKRGEQVILGISLEPLPPGPSKPPAPPPLAVVPFSAEQAGQHQRAWANHIKLPAETRNGIGMKLALIPPGEFWMGSSPAEVQRWTERAKRESWRVRDYVVQRLPREMPQHRVSITRPVYVSVYEVTVGQFRQFVESARYRTDAERDPQGGFGLVNGTWERRPDFNWRNPGFEQGDDHPVCNVSWDDAVALCAWLSEQEKIEYRLLSEAEWEYACRAGTTTPFHSGEEESLRLVANVADASLRQKYPEVGWAVPWDDGYPYTAPVGRFQPNAFGLYDMHGNVWEWCRDRYGSAYYGKSPAQDPPGPDTGTYRVFRGGGWDNHPVFCRSADRYSSHHLGTVRTDWAGFRVARTVPETKAAE